MPSLAVQNGGGSSARAAAAGFAGAGFGVRGCAIGGGS
jgi:hypothetical protein